MSPDKKTRVLVVEDEALIGMFIEEFLGSYGYAVVGPVENLKSAVLLAATEPIDVAIVDINIAGQTATAVADSLLQRRVPFLFVSGQVKALDPRYDSIPLLRKPFTPEQLNHAVQDVIRRKPPN